MLFSLLLTVTDTVYFPLGVKEWVFVFPEVVVVEPSIVQVYVRCVAFVLWTAVRSMDSEVLVTVFVGDKTKLTNGT
jgi:hypothetical protein